MSLDAEIRSTAKSAASADSYDRIAKAVHWTTLLLIAGVYVTVWTSHAVGSREQSALLVQLHRSIGVTIFALTLFRLAWRWIARIPPPPAELPLFQRVAARATEYVLYLLLLLQPALGLLNTNARGRRRLLPSRRVTVGGRPRQGIRQTGDDRARVRRLPPCGACCPACGRRAFPPLCPPRQRAERDAPRPPPLRPSRMSPSALSGCPNAIPLHGGMKLSKGQAFGADARGRM